MKKRAAIFLCLALTIGAFAQTQRGNVKTRKGYVREVRENSNGKGGFNYLPLPMVTIKITGNIGTESNKNGMFELSPNNPTFQIARVSKSNYKLITPSNYTKTYNCTSELLEITMVNEETWNRRNKDKQIKAERNLNKDKNNELDKLYEKREKGQISEGDYFKRLDEIDDKYKKRLESTNRFIEDYTSAYFRGMDSINKQLNDYLIEGKYREFDSLMKTKGDFSQREEEIRQLNEVEQAAKTAKEKRIEELAADFFREHQKFSQQFIQDSALHYLLRRSALDTTNIVWLGDVAEFYLTYIGDYGKALNYDNKSYIVI